MLVTDKRLILHKERIRDKFFCGERDGRFIILLCKKES